MGRTRVLASLGLAIVVAVAGTNLWHTSRAQVGLGSHRDATSSVSSIPSVATAAPTASAPLTVAGLAAGVVPGHRTRTELAAAGATLPVGDLPGWRQVFTEDFSTPVAPGGFASSSYRTHWVAYDGTPDTHGIGRYDQDLLSVSDGHLDAALQTIDGVPRVTGLVPEVGGRWGGQTYGRYSVRFRADAAPGYAPAIFLWPDSNVWNDGEVDFVEGVTDGWINSFNHCPGHAADACAVQRTTQVWPDWHVATVEWTPKGITCFLDSTPVLTSTAVPRAPMHLVLQQMARPGVPATSTPHVQVDWVSIWSYAPGQGTP